ncbi:RDD family protein [Micrococcaceae bacterium Sec5.7]
MAANSGLVPAAAGRRLGAAVLDWLGPLVVLVAMFAVGFAGVTRTRSGGFIVYDTGSLVLFGGIAIGLVLIYMSVIMGLEGRSGNTIGNQLMGIRSADNDGYAPGAGGVFVRGIVTGGGILLAVIAAIFVVIFKWFDPALFILGPLVVIGAAWAVVVVLSNSWDKNAKLRGWHDAAAKTLVFDVKAGRNPIATGGIQGPYSFAPLDLPPIQQVSSPVAATQSPAAAQQSTPQPQPIPKPQAVQPPQAIPQPQAHLDDDHDRTQMRGGAQQPAPLAVLRIRLDDGRDFRLDRNVLIGRNPNGHPGEQQAQLFAVVDPGRSISKTHLHLLTDGAGVWVTDRNSTNGSAVTTPDGVRTPLRAGVPAFVSPGSTVHFGDRNFHLGQA